MLRLSINEMLLILTENLVERVLYPQLMYEHSAKAG